MTTFGTSSFTFFFSTIDTKEDHLANKSQSMHQNIYLRYTLPASGTVALIQAILIMQLIICLGNA